MKAQLNKYPWTKLLEKGDIHVIHEPQHKNIAHIYKGNRHSYHKVNPQKWVQCIEGFGRRKVPIAPTSQTFLQVTTPMPLHSQQGSTQPRVQNKSAKEGPLLAATPFSIH